MATAQEIAKNILANMEVIKAAAEGKTIEIKVGGKWTEWGYYDFTCSPSSYRIKREPIVRYVVMRGTNHVVMFTARVYAEEWVGKDTEKYHIVELREVVKE